MKKLRVLILLGCLFATTNVYGQFAAKIGYTSAGQSWQNSDNSALATTERLSGTNVGVSFGIIKMPFIGLRGEANYIQKGMKVSTPAIASGENRIDMIALEIHGLIKFSSPVLAPYIFAGPRFDIKVKTKSTSYWKKFYDNLNSSVQGLSIGVGAEILSTLPINPFAELKYEYDLGNIYDSDNLTIKNNAVSFRVGVQF
jgi:hypothetical protein